MKQTIVALVACVLTVAATLSADTREIEPGVWFTDFEDGQKGPLVIGQKLLLWDDVWDWTLARDVFADDDLSIEPRDEEGYVGVTLTLQPGEGRLIATDAQVSRKK